MRAACSTPYVTSHKDKSGRDGANVLLILWHKPPPCVDVSNRRKYCDVTTDWAIETGTEDKVTPGSAAEK